MADLSPVVGSEQGGRRPVLVIQNNVGNRFSATVIAAAVTSVTEKNKLPTHLWISRKDSGLEKDSVVLLEQIRTIDKSRLGARIGRLREDMMRQVEAALVVSLGFNE